MVPCLGIIVYNLYGCTNLFSDQIYIRQMNINLNDMEKAVYGCTIEDDKELLKELLSLQQKEKVKLGDIQETSTTSNKSVNQKPALPYVACLGPNVLNDVLAEPKDITDEELDQDPELMNELLKLVGSDANDIPSQSNKSNSMIKKSAEQEIQVNPLEVSPSSRVELSGQTSLHLSKADILRILKRRRDKYVVNGKAAVGAQDKVSAKEFVETAKLFDQAISALDTASSEELDISEIPPSPPPYKRKEQPKTFMDGLESRKKKFEEIAEKARIEGNLRKARMNSRMADQYVEAIRNANSGRTVIIADLPTLPDMIPLPPQYISTKPSEKVWSPAEVKSLDASTSSKFIKKSTNLEFLIHQQNIFKKAAVDAKSKGNLELAKKYLIEAKGFDKIIAAARSGQPISIKDAHIPPQSITSFSNLQPLIVSKANSFSGIEGRSEVLSIIEKTLIEQIQLSETNRMRFTRLGDVGKANLFESWARTSKQDLLFVREVAKQGLEMPKFHYENRQIPMASLFPELAEDLIEFNIIGCRDVPLPSGYNPSDANLFIKYLFPYPNEVQQTGKTKTISGTQSPQFNEVVMLNIGNRKSRGFRLIRALKRNPMKIEVYQKGSFLRSDKLLGSCEWKLVELENTAELEESLPLRDGRKAVGGLVTLRIRAREPIGDPKLRSTQHKWLILNN